jgi:hypothetical protein
MRRLPFYLWLAMLYACAQDKAYEGPAPQKPRPPTNERPAVPPINIHVDMVNPAKARLTIEGLDQNADPEHDTVGYRIRWTLDGKSTAYPETTTEVTSEIPRPTEVWFADIVKTHVWSAYVTPFDAYGPGAAVTAAAEVKLRLACDPHPTEGYVYIGCDDRYVYSAFVASAIPDDDATAEAFLREQTAQSFFPPTTNATSQRALNFVNLLFMDAFNRPGATLDYNLATYAYRPVVSLEGPFTGPDRTIGAGGYDPEPFLDRTCLDVPLVGSICLNGYVWDNDNATQANIVDFAPQDVTFAVSKAGTQWLVDAYIHSPALDVLFEPPPDPTLTDIPNPTSNDYDPSRDLSAYVKAHGRVAFFGTFRLRFDVDFEAPNLLLYKLRLLSLNDNAAQFLSAKGPYCHNNLGTVIGSTTSPRPVLDNFHPYPDIVIPPPFQGGVPLYPGLVSDANTLGVLSSYYARFAAPYPHADTSPAGGSGAGRDGMGVKALAYEYNDAAGRHSDNPNNCRFPADACTVSLAQAGYVTYKVQDGGPEWNGPSASCQYPNVSDASDDATFKISEQISVISPFLQLATKHFITDQLHAPRPR